MKVARLGSGRVIRSFSYSPEKQDVIDYAIRLATQDNLTFSEWLLSIVEERVHREKNLMRSGENPLNLTYDKPRQKSIDDLLEPFTTLDEYLFNSPNGISWQDMARVEGCAFKLMQKAKRKYKEIRMSQTFGGK